MNSNRVVNYFNSAVIGTGMAITASALRKCEALPCPCYFSSALIGAGMAISAGTLGVKIITDKLPEQKQKVHTLKNEKKSCITQKDIYIAEKNGIDISESSENIQQEGPLKQCEECQINKVNENGVNINRTKEVKEVISKLIEKEDWNKIKARELRKIDVLYLDGKNIKELQVSDFECLTNLVKISLHNNPIKKLPKGIFRQLRELKELTLSCTQITELSDEIKKEILPRLKEITLDANQNELLSVIQEINPEIEITIIQTTKRN